MTNLASIFAGLFVLYAATASAQVSPKFLARQDFTGLYTQCTGIGDTNGTFRIGPSENTVLEIPNTIQPVDIVRVVNEPLGCCILH